MVILSLAQDEKVYLVKFENRWAFSIGDKAQWAQPEFDASEWDQIKVPSAWEDQGFYGYDGYAWYRLSFVANKEMKNHDMFVDLGYIDDVDQVYLNGKLIGFSGVFPPDYSTPLEAKRKYPIPDEYINYQDKNILSIRVYNHQMTGGIISGEPGLFYYKTAKPEISLKGLWKAHSGDNRAWKQRGIKDRNWNKLNVPGNWENQGYKGYDGAMWIRKTFSLTEDLASLKLVLILQDINDCEVFINGKEISKLDKAVINVLKTPSEDVDKYAAFMLNENTLQSSGYNTIAIRIPKKTSEGGISFGPIGFYKISSYSKNFKPVNGN
jgi:sialate O-acetylesterase